MSTNNIKMLFDKLAGIVPQKINIKQNQIQDFLIVMNNNQEAFYLNETAAFCYNLCDSSNTIQSIFLQLIKEYKIPEDNQISVMNDVVFMIRDFQWEGIIELFGG